MGEGEVVAVQLSLPHSRLSFWKEVLPPLPPCSPPTTSHATPIQRYGGGGGWQGEPSCLGSIRGVHGFLCFGVQLSTKGDSVQLLPF